jgi:sugar phosphate isomerase/epimerase
MNASTPIPSPRINRRESLRHIMAGAAGLAAAGCRFAGGPGGTPSGAHRLRGRINHSLVSWPYMAFGEKWSLDELCRVAKDLGATSVELVGPEDWPTLAKYGLSCAITPNGMPGEPYVKGLNNPAYQAAVIESTRRVMEAAAAAPIQVPAVIAFTGFAYRDVDHPEAGVIPPDEGADHTVEGLKKLAALAEPLGLGVYVEHLNSRVEGDVFRGHPGYQGDHIDYCAEIIRRVGAPHVKLLFDIYHVQVMDGDLIRRIRDYGTDLIGHIHTAGVPGRAELDDRQELHYPSIMQALVDIGYTGFVGHEFIPTRDPREGLREAIAVCDV